MKEWDVPAVGHPTPSPGHTTQAGTSHTNWSIPIFSRLLRNGMNEPRRFPAGLGLSVVFQTPTTLRRTSRETHQIRPPSPAGRPTSPRSLPCSSSHLCISLAALSLVTAGLRDDPGARGSRAARSKGAAARRPAWCVRRSQHRARRHPRPQPAWRTRSASACPSRRGGHCGWARAALQTPPRAGSEPRAVAAS